MTAEIEGGLSARAVRVTIVSSDANASVTASALSAWGHDVVLMDAAGTRQSLPPIVRIRDRGWEPAGEVESESVGFVFAEGEDVRRGLERLIAEDRPAVIVCMGGGIAGAVLAIRAAEDAGIVPARLCVVSGFYFGGSRDGDVMTVDSEKNGLVAGFAAPASLAATDLVLACLPLISLKDVRAVALSGLNPTIHVPGMILNAAAIERGDGVGFYRDAFGENVASLAQALDAERRSVGAALGLPLPGVAEVLGGYYAADGMRGVTLHEMVSTFSGYASIRLPTSFTHRFLLHELVGTLIPLAIAGDALDVNVSLTRACIRVGEVLIGRRLNAPLPDAEILKFFGIDARRGDSNADG